MNDDTDEDERRRRNEMNMFAMMAGGGAGAGDQFNSNSIAIQSTEDLNVSTELNNAAALFEEEDGPMATSLNANHTNNNNATRGPLSSLPARHGAAPPSESPGMFAERILLPRPLFFGSKIPSSITKHAKDDNPNLQNALEFFSNDTVITYQPNFINREESVTMYRQKYEKPDIIARVSTAPARLSPPTPVFDALDEIQDESEGSLRTSLNPMDIVSLSDQEKFSQWALMGSSVDTLGMSGESFRFSATSNVARQHNSVLDSDDDSMIEDEQKTKVGASDNLNKAVALLSDDGLPAPELETTQVLLSQVAPDGSRKRPLTNYELTEGCTPLFAADDPPLPQESDLGIHETREEQQKSMEKKRVHEMIDKFVPPNVFGSVSCPNMAKHPDDCRTTRSHKSRRSRSPVKPPKSRGKETPNASPVKSSTNHHKTRYGWWNVPWDEKDEDSSSIEDENALQLPPIQHSANGLHIYSPLGPTPEQLKRDNLPLSRMHSATSMIHTLPFLSDRPPSHRHLQIDTQAVAFPPIKEEIEPFFCSMAIYNVETVAGTSSKSPLPDLQRCGRVTEALYFDYHADASTERRCYDALWPYDGDHIGTRCGIFPIPSNLDVTNLYAVLIVRKVVGSSNDELDPYLKPGKQWTDVDKLKLSAARASEKNGQLLMPFAFGVAPLLQVFGLENPVTASSRAVQIPLFHFSKSERQIINHIMYMLFPRADHSGVGGPAPVTNGGTAMLVMRNFGYLGLHTAVNKSSVLARDRLVDFTGSLQLRRRGKEVETNDDSDSYDVRAPPWRPHYISEPTRNGGRAKAGLVSIEGTDSGSRLYAQELALWPVQMTLSNQIQSSSQSGISSVRCQNDTGDIEPTFYTSFCNEMLCHPRILHNAPNSRLVLKIELREVEWNAKLNVYCAHEVSEAFSGTGIHNHRRGPPLVKSAFTSCTPEKRIHQFIEDFKIKLPLHLDAAGQNRKLSLFFTIYRLKNGQKAMWKSMFQNSSAEQEVEEIVRNGRTVRLVCGYLPLSTSSCLLEDGIHDVSMCYKSVVPSPEICNTYNVPASSLLLQEEAPVDDLSPNARDETSYHDDFEKDTDASVATEATEARSANDDSYSMWSKTRREPLSLSVRLIAHSSLHSQNGLINKVLSSRRGETALQYSQNKHFMAALRMGRDYIVANSRDKSPSESPVGDDSLLQAIVGLGNSQLCPPRVAVAHLPRLGLTLWRQIILGMGQASLEWANPSTSPPLRRYSFLTLFRLVGSASVFMAQNGNVNVDNSEKFSSVALGRMLALLFDEQKLFPGSQEAFDLEYWYFVLNSQSDENSPSAKKAPPTKRRRHVRSTFDLANEIPPRPSTSALSQVSIQSSSAGDLATLPKHNPRENEWSDVFDLCDQSNPNDTPPKLPESKLDSKSDFQNFLRAAVTEENDEVVETNQMPSNNDHLREQAQSFSASYGAPGRRFHTLPPNVLTTIPEGDYGEDTNRSFLERQESQSSLSNSNLSLDGLTVNITEAESQTRPQMRRPKLKKPSQGSSTDIPISPENTTRNLVPIQCDDQIESMGTAFLDTIAEDILRGKDGEEPRVGSTHHRRRTNGWSSIDWSLTVDDRVSSPPSAPNEEEMGPEFGYDESNDSMASLREEEKASIRMPNFSERLVILGDTMKDVLTGRWFPFTYEVIIFQWAKLLQEPDKRKDGRWSNMAYDPLVLAGAPMMFEIMKHSIGFRAKSLFKEVISKERNRETPPLLILDDSLLSSFTMVIMKVTDACLDHNNFDSSDLLQLAANVNEAIATFLRDLFGFLAPSNVYSLIMTYFSRFSTKRRPNAADRESSLGLRCSWELARMRLNAISVFARFSEFTKVNSPQMLGWEKWWASSPSRSKGTFYDKILCHFEEFRFPQFSGICDQHNEMPIGSMRPHWLAEVLVDVCLAGIEHAEHKIQLKSAAILYEMMWASSQESVLSGIATPVASMYLTIIEKFLSRSTYLSNFSPKSQLRRDIMTCLVYVLQSTSPELLRALWRRLCSKLPGEGSGSTYGFGLEDKNPENQQKEAYSVLDMFSLLNLALRTLEYDGCDEIIDVETTNVTKSSLEAWHRDFLPSSSSAVDITRQSNEPKVKSNTSFTTAASRKWQAHDGSIVIVRVVNQVVRELYNTLSKSTNGKALLNPAIRSNQRKSRENGSDSESKDRLRSIDISKNDIVIFIRGATSVYLHSLSLQESDVVIEKTFVYTAEVIKIFGVRLFLEAVGETLQHWMRVVSFHCGARRSQVRIASTDLLELILRSTWECFGSFFRIRVPLLAVQTEVMERMVALAAARYFKEQRRLGSNFEPFNNLGAEASLVPLWRTLDRIENNPASQNVAFRGALVRIAGKLKKLYRAYVAARALSFVKPGDKSDIEEQDETSKYETDSRVRAIRMHTLRVLNASEGFTKQFLSMRGATQISNRVAHYEAVEDSLLDAANVFSPTELPEHRVAWLRMLAQLHGTRQKHAEEAACRYLIHVTLRLASRLHGSLWSNTPFLPWTDDIPDPVVYIDAEASQAGDVDSYAEGSEWEYGSHYGSTNSFRRIFYRVATSVRDHNIVWDTGINKNLFFGVTFAPEYSSVNPWLTLREMEDNMISEVETSGALFLKAGIVENSRCAWGLAAEYHTEKFNFEKLAMVYEQLASAIVSKVLPIDTSLPQEVSTTFGRFYRVWLHGEAPDELRGIEFVYRSTSRLKDFGEEIRSVIKSIMSKMTPVHLVLDGLSEDSAESSGKAVQHSRFNIGPAQLTPVSIKVTPLRPLFSKFSNTRGIPEWFHRYIAEQYEDARLSNHRTNALSLKSLSTVVKGGDRQDTHHQHSRSFSATVFSSTGSTGITNGSRKSLANPFLGESDRSPRALYPRKTDLLGVDKFCFIQPIDHHQQKEWWKAGNFVEKCLRVLELQVAEPFPACVGRQKVIQRNRFNQSPLEAAIDALCQWCAVLYRTAVATTGISLMMVSNDPGIGTDASKIVADCIHNSHVKEITSTMLTDSAKLPHVPGDSDRLREDDICKLQLKLARLVVTFMELLHILISRNRDELLEVIKDRKKETGGRHHNGSSTNGSRVAFHRAQSLGPRDIGSGWHPGYGPTSSDQNSLPQRHKSDGTSFRAEENRQRVVTGGSEDNHSYHSTMTNPGVRTDSAIAVQSELQRSFINLAKSLHKNIQFVMREDTPPWLAQCCQEYYFSRGTYRSNRMPIIDELCFQCFERNDHGTLHSTLHGHDHGHPLHNTSMHSDHGCESPRAGSVSGQSHRSFNSGLSRNSTRM